MKTNRSNEPQAPVPPRHVAIIMDGNGRWAKKRGLPRIEGHRKGAQRVRKVVEYARELGVEVLTLYAFSVENWNRPRHEVDALMQLLERFLDRELPSMIEKEIRFKVVGRLGELPASIQTRVREAEAATAAFCEHTLVLALNYGSRTEIVDACQSFARAVAAGEARPEDLDYGRLARHLYTADLPDPDLVIRTSGESRLSNFLLLQSAYAEWVFSEVNWPEFKRKHFEDAIAAFHKRERRFGKTTEQLKTEAQPTLHPATHETTHP